MGTCVDIVAAIEGKYSNAISSVFPRVAGDDGRGPHFGSLETNSTFAFNSRQPVQLDEFIYTFLTTYLSFQKTSESDIEDHYILEIPPHSPRATTPALSPLHVHTRLLPPCLS